MLVVVTDITSSIFGILSTIFGFGFNCTVEGVFRVTLIACFRNKGRCLYPRVAIAQVMLHPVLFPLIYNFSRGQ